MTLYLYLITRKGDLGYDEYDGFVVAAACREDAIHIHPREDTLPDTGERTYTWDRNRKAWLSWSERNQCYQTSWSETWVSPENVDCRVIGVVLEGSGIKEGEVLLTDFLSG